MNPRPLVMVVEDDEEMNRLQQELLASHGLDAVPAYTGTEALIVYQQSNADAVLLDVMLPEMDGFETCRRLRQTAPAHLPIIIVTALDSDDCRERGRKAGANAYFSKPFDPNEVIDTIRSLLSMPDNGDSRRD